MRHSKMTLHKHFFIANCISFYRSSFIFVLICKIIERYDLDNLLDILYSLFEGLIMKHFVLIYEMIILYYNSMEKYTKFQYSTWECVLTSSKSPEPWNVLSSGVQDVSQEPQDY